MITSSDASGVYYTSKSGVRMEMSGGMNNEGFMVQRHLDQINFRSYNFRIKKIVFRCLDNALEGDHDSFYWGPTTMYIAANSSVGNIVAGTLTTPYNGSTYMAKWESSPTYPDGLPIGQQLTILCKGHPVRFAYIEITIDKDDGDMYELVTSADQVVHDGKKTYMLVHRLNATTLKGDALSSNQQDESTSGHFKSTEVDLYNNGWLAKSTGEVMLLRFSENNAGSSSVGYPYYILAGGAYFRTESSTETVGSYTTRRLSRTNGMNLPNNPDFAYASIDVNSVAGTNGFGHYAKLGYRGINNHHIRHYNGASQFRNIQDDNSYVAQQRVFLYKPAQKYEVFTGTDGNGTITLRDGVVVDGSHNYAQIMENVSFIVAPAEGYKVKSVTITNLTDNSDVNPGSVTTTTLGDNYIFSMPNSNVRVYAEFEEVQYHNILMEIKPSPACGNIFLTGGYVVRGDDVLSYDGQNVVFRVTANPIEVGNEGAGYYELYNVTLTSGETVTTLTADEDGNYHFTMPDNDVTITANFKKKHKIITACEPEAGGYFNSDAGYMTCNGNNTNFYNGAQYYIGDQMGFKVFTRFGYRISRVTVTDTDGGVITLTPTSTNNDGNWYSFVMPNSDVTITAYFHKTETDLYLLGTHNGQAWHPYGPKFNYDADTQTYWIDVYYKGEDTAYGQETQDEGDKYGYFAVTTAIAGDKNTSENDINNNCWPTANGSRYGSKVEDNHQIAGTYDNASLTGTGTLDKNQNVFMVPAGVYRIEVTGSTDANNKFTPEQVNVTRTDVALTLDPAGGNSAENAVEVSWGTDVTMTSDIQTKVHEIADAYKAAYPQYVDDNFAEANVSFNYSIAETTDLTDVKQSGTPTLEAPEFPLVNYDINEEVPVTVKVDGNAWIGWIHAPATEYYKVVKTPLKWIEEYGDLGKDYVVSNQLLGVKRVNNSLWCKDLAPYESYEKTEPFSPDYMSQFAGLLTWCNRTEWDQSNWVELDFGTLGQAADFEGKLIEAATIKGTYYNPNHKIVLKQLPTIGADQSYDPNYFSPANFMSKNIDVDGAESVLEDNNGNKRRYYFLNPKVQEYGVVTMAVWVGDQAKNPGQNLFVMPAKSEDGAVNGNDFDGALAVDWSLNNWDNAECDPNQSGNMNLKENGGDDGTVAEGPQAYTFHAIIRVNESAGNVQAPARMRSSVDGKDPTKMELDNKYVVYPLDLVVDQTHIVTAVQTVTVGKAVQSVTYCDLAGRMSRRPLQGVNIIVTRYTDGTVTTSKAVF